AAISRPAPATRRVAIRQSSPGGSACCFPARADAVICVCLVVVSRRVIASVRPVVVRLASVGAPSGSVPVAAGAGRGTACGRGCCAAGGGDFVPQAAGRVQAVALVLAGSGVAGEGVQRVPVEGGLDRAVGALDRAERARDPGCGHRSGHRRPVLRARPVAVGLGGRVGGKGVQRETLAAGQHRRTSDRGALQAARGRTAATTGGGRRGGSGRAARDQSHRGCHRGRQRREYPEAAWTAADPLRATAAASAGNLSRCHDLVLFLPSITYFLLHSGFSWVIGTKRRISKLC